MEQLGYVVVLLAIMVATGLVGGVVNYLMSLDDEDRKATGTGSGEPGTFEDPRLLRRSLITGVAAAFIVPLFLRLSSGGTDDLITNVLKADSKQRAADLFVIAAFCLVAAISARSFIQTVSERVLQQAKDASRRAQEAQKEVAELREEGTEGELDEAAAAQAGTGSGGPALAGERKALLTAINDSSFTRRSTGGLAAETKIGRQRAQEELEAMVEEGLVEKTLSTKDKAPRWRITSPGRTAVLRARLET